MCDEESRCGRAHSDEEICYQLRGKFGKSRDERTISDLPHLRLHQTNLSPSSPTNNAFGKKHP